MILVGDFNVIVALHEKQGGIFSPHKTLEDFRDFILENILKDILPKKGKFTWTNRRKEFLQIVVHLDRFLVSQEWIIASYNLISQIFPFVCFDHYGISLEILGLDFVVEHIPSFKFEKMWFRHPHFLPFL